MNRMVLDTSLPQDRVVRVVNVHRQATAQQVLKHFENAHPLSASRGRNSKTKNYNIAYLYFETRENRMIAEQLNGSTLLGRVLTVAPAKSGFFCACHPFAMNGSVTNDLPVVNGQIVAEGEDVSDTASAPSSSLVSSPDVSNTEKFPPLEGDNGKQGTLAPLLMATSTFYTHLNGLTCELDTSQDMLTRFRSPSHHREVTRHTHQVRQQSHEAHWQFSQHPNQDRRHSLEVFSG